MATDSLRGPKRSLRKRILALRDALDETTRRDYSLLIADRVESLPEWQSAKTVHLFASFGSEVDTTGLIERALATGRRPVLPVVEGSEREMSHALITSLGDLEPGYRQIPEPAARCERVSAGQIDLVLVPGLAFDVNGGRLGYGGGFYDSFLDACPGGRIAVAFGIQIVGTVPRAAHDLPVHAIVTESETIRVIPGTSPDRT